MKDIVRKEEGSFMPKNSGKPMSGTVRKEEGSFKTGKGMGAPVRNEEGTFDKQSAPQKSGKS